MKKIIIIGLVVLSVLFFNTSCTCSICESCDNYECKSNPRHNDKFEEASCSGPYIIVLQETNGTKTHIRRWEYTDLKTGHDIWIFHIGPEYSIIHSPECKKCKRLGNNIESSSIFNW